MTTGSTVLVFPGSTSSTSRRVLRKEVLYALRTSDDPVILDLRGCCTLDHDDINFLLECVSQAVGRDTQLLFTVGSRDIHVLLEVTRISSLVRVFESFEEAIEFTSQYKTASRVSPAPQFNQAGVVP